MCFIQKKIKTYGLGFLSFLKNSHYEKRIDKKHLLKKMDRYIFFLTEKNRQIVLGPKTCMYLVQYLCSNLGKNLTRVVKI